MMTITAARAFIVACGLCLLAGLGHAQAVPTLVSRGAGHELDIPYLEFGANEARQGFAVRLTSGDLAQFALDAASVTAVPLQAASPTAAMLTIENDGFALHLPQLRFNQVTGAAELRSSDVFLWSLRSFASDPNPPAPAESRASVASGATPVYFKWCVLTGASGVRGEDFAWLWINGNYDLATGSTWTTAGYTCPDRNKYTGFNSKGVEYKSCAKWKNTTDTGAPLGINGGVSNLVHGVLFNSGLATGSIAFTGNMGQQGCSDGATDNAASCYHLFMNPDTDTNLCSCGSPKCGGGYTWPSTYLSYGGPARGGNPVTGTPSAPRASDSGCVPTLGGGAVNVAAYGLTGTFTPSMVYWEVTPTTACVAPGATMLRGRRAVGPVN